MSIQFAFLFWRKAFPPKCTSEPIKLGWSMPKPKESSIDVDNPPDEVREAAADMGLSVTRYKKRFLDRPSMCEIMTSFYDMCVHVNPDNVSKCSSFLENKENKYNCSKFLEKYSGQWSKY